MNHHNVGVLHQNNICQGQGILFHLNRSIGEETYMHNTGQRCECLCPVFKYRESLLETHLYTQFEHGYFGGAITF